MSAPTAAPAITYPETATVPATPLLTGDAVRVRIRYRSHPLNGQLALLRDFRRSLDWGFATFGPMFHVVPVAGDYPGGFWFAREHLEPCDTEAAIAMAACQP